MELPPRASLAQRAAASEAWLERHAAVVAAGGGDGAPVAAAAVEAAVREAKPLQKVAEVAEGAKPLSALLGWRDEWAARAHAAFVKPGSTRSLLGVLRDDDADAHWPPQDDENLHSCACC